MKGIALAACLACSAAHAQDGPRFSLAAWGVDSGGHAGNAGAALTYALLGSIAQSGWRLQAVALQGKYRYSEAASPDGEVRGRYTDLSVALGYEWVGDAGSFSLSAGPAWHDKALSFVPAGEQTGMQTGTKVSAGVSSRLGSVATLNGFTSFSTADRTSYSQAQLGIPVFWGLAAGPEVALLEAKDFRQKRAGVHLSGIRLGPVSAGVSLGATRDQNGNRGHHVGLSAWTSF